ncbi:phage putative head morphogenesis protein, SPP1 gp7 family [Photorhabdus luminescens]|uniref:Phage putative head morphogenesis protein, SPP1 gp7 family n=2 Tax=Morganellaceae TaxID=1903414 RepID=A0A1G5RDM2_PHOLU|nr:phage putative head morphogenesis protein, SPP1 gp7 family [Photorhabdus luminescens]
MGEIVTGYDGSQASADTVSGHLIDYSQVLDDWIASVAHKMFLQVECEEWRQWRSVSQQISEGLRDVVGNTPVGQVAQDVVYRQIQLMKSLPLEAAERVKEIQDRAIQAVINGERPDELYKMIMQSSEVAAGRARMIARTEIGRATTALTQARALSVGSEGYWWRIEGAGTRPSHKEMRDKFVRWEDPPTLDGMTGHAGCLPNCKCWPEVHIPPPRS